MTTADDTRQRLIEAAGLLFAEKGLRATTVRDICRAAGADRAAIKYHLGHKHLLYLESVRTAGQHCMERVPWPQWDPGTPADRKLHDFVLMMLRRVAIDHEPAWHAQLIMREMAHPTPACAEFVRDFVRPNFEMLSGILGELLPPGVPARRRMLCAFSIVGQCLHYRFTRPVTALLLGPEEFAALDVETLADHITEFSLAALHRLAARAGKRVRS